MRRRLVCRGSVQGVGFRPSVFRLASARGLAGWVCNDPGGATIEIEGPRATVDTFRDVLADNLPPLARLDALEVIELIPVGATSFEITDSAPGARSGALLPPDTALCGDCRSEMETPGDRRYRYPFTTCTNCGPRFSLARALPYDRERTSMACFPLCPECAREYRDPADRRFHAEPVCCPACGPRLWLQGQGTGDTARGTEALVAARGALASGAIVAVKGLGGLQLACRADDAAAVARLRERKRRASKPFAVMVRDLDAARTLVTLRPEDEALLSSVRAPVLLAPRRVGAPVTRGVAPDLEDVGVMLPTTPLHAELFRDARFDALVMTSGNASDEPICRSNREALGRLAGIADCFLLHDRDIVRRVDDSVVRTAPIGHTLVRRSRGWVPEPVSLPVAAPEPVLALGGHLLDTVCIAVGSAAFASQHIGDLDTELARDFLVEVVDNLESFLQVEAKVIAVDEHPDYPSAWLGESLAAQRGATLLRVQHHLAHAVGVLAEHDRFPDPAATAAAIVLDGTGYGRDGVAWGGEYLVVGGDLSWRRAAHLEPLPLVGGERAVREPWRVLVAALVRAGAANLIAELPMCAVVGGDETAAAARLAAREGWPSATGAGRVFEAAGALLGGPAKNEWEGAAAVYLESLAARSGSAVAWDELTIPAGVSTLPTATLLAAAARRLLAGESPERVAAGFHASFSRLTVELAARVFTPGSTVALGGGCLVNRILIRELATGLARAGLEPLFARAMPPGDGGLAYGQAAVAAISGARGVSARFEGGP